MLKVPQDPTFRFQTLSKVEVQKVNESKGGIQFASIQIFDKAHNDKKIGNPFLLPFNLNEDDFEYAYFCIREKLKSIQENPHNNLEHMKYDNFVLWTLNYQYYFQDQIAQMYSYDWNSASLHFELLPSSEYKLIQLRNSLQIHPMNMPTDGWFELLYLGVQVEIIDPVEFNTNQIPGMGKGKELPIRLNDSVQAASLSNLDGNEADDEQMGMTAPNYFSDLEPEHRKTAKAKKQ